MVGWEDGEGVGVTMCAVRRGEKGVEWEWVRDCF